MTTSQQFAQDILKSIDASPTPFHAVETLKQQLLDAGFEELYESDDWQLEPQKNACERYFVTRNDSSIVAFILGQQDALQSGIRMLGAHTDSPCLKVKPQPNVQKHNYIQLGVEVYGGAILHPWFDRDLALAGRVSFVNKQGQVESCLLDSAAPIALIPNLAIHLNREVNSKHSVNAQQHLAPVIAINNSTDNESFTFEDYLRQQIKAQHSGLEVGKLLEFEMSFYDFQKASLVGLNQEIVTSARLDNLLSCFIGIQSLLASDGQQTSFLVCNDHEEVGSSSASGAQGPMLESVLLRVFANSQQLTRVLDRSMMVSIDNAHAVHPNYSSLHEPQHLPLLNRGPVLKINNNQRYASNSETQALFAHCCEQAGVNLQRFVTRSDLACGSTIGPISATTLGVKTVDVGIPSLAMHSIRESAGTDDLYAMHQALNVFLNLPTLWAS